MPRAAVSAVKTDQTHDLTGIHPKNPSPNTLSRRKRVQILYLLPLGEGLGMREDDEPQLLFSSTAGIYDSFD